jgi:EmrB/QacA subfamily drug resistance transporter
MSATETSLTGQTPEPNPPAHDDDHIDRALLIVSGAVVLGAIMSILDTTVVNVAIHTLADRFHTTLPTIQWVATGYTLALAAVIPLSGWIADRYGTKRLYMTSIGLFIIGSCLSGLAWSSTSIIVFRVLQGLGGGMIMPTGMTILTRAAGAHRIGRVMAIIGVPMLIGPIVGPILGGWLVTDVDWRWIFFINLPVGIIALVYAFRVLPRDVGSPGEPLDFVDFLLLSPGLAILIYGLAETNSAGGFGHAKVIIPLLVGIVLIVAFVLHALRAKHPLIDLRLFAKRAFSTSSVSLALMVIAIFGSFLLLPLYFQEVRGESALMSGVLLAPQGLGSMLMMPIAGNLADKTGSGRIAPFGLIIIAITMVALTQLGASTSYVTICIILFFNGVGMGLTMMPIFTGALQSVAGPLVARASTMLNVIQQTAASIGTAVLSVVLASAIGAASQSTKTPTPAEIKTAAPHLAAGFDHTFWWAFAFVVIAFIASLALPKSVPENAEGGGAMMVG